MWATQVIKQCQNITHCEGKLWHVMLLYDPWSWWWNKGIIMWLEFLAKKLSWIPVLSIFLSFYRKRQIWDLLFVECHFDFLCFLNFAFSEAEINHCYNHHRQQCWDSYHHTDPVFLHLFCQRRKQSRIILTLLC